MANNFFSKTGNPVNNSSGSSSLMRAEFAAIEAGFDKQPTLTANGSKIVAVNATADALEAITTTGTGSGVRATSPTLVTPVLGVAAATSINKVTVTAPATAATLTLAAGSALATSGAFSTTLTATGATNVTLPTTGTLATLAGAEALTNKTLTSPTMTTPALGTPSSGTLTNCTGLPAAGVAGTALTAAATVTVAQGGTGRATSTTAYGLLAAGTTATGAHQTLASGAATEVLVGGGASALPVWTTATGSGAPVRATSPTLVTPILGTPTSGNLANCTFPTLNQNTTGNAATATTAGSAFAQTLLDDTTAAAARATLGAAASGANTDITSLGAVTGVTATLGDNTTKLATTAFVLANAPTVAAASETVAGKIELATSAEAIAGTDAVRAITPAGLRSGFNAGGTAPVYACRAWVNFNGTGTVAIRASGNVSSITDGGAGSYTVNFTTSMPDANYAVNAISYVVAAGNVSNISCEIGVADRTTSGVPIITKQSGTAIDSSVVCVSIFR